MKDVVDLQQTNLEWRQTTNYLSSSVSKSLDHSVFWQSVFEAKNIAGNIQNPQLSRMVSLLFSLPYSNAAVERLFSQLKLIKNDHRASLKNESVLGLITAKTAFQKKVQHQAAVIDPPHSMLRLHSKMKASADNDQCSNIRKLFLSGFNEK